MIHRNIALKAESRGQKRSPSEECVQPISGFSIRIDSTEQRQRVEKVPEPVDPETPIDIVSRGAKRGKSL